MLYPETHRFPLIAAVCCVLLLSAGCVQKYYAPNSLSMPLLNDGQAAGSLSYSAGEEFDAIEVQTAASIGHHLALMCNYFGANGEDKGLFSEGANRANGRLLEFGAGYRSRIGQAGFRLESFAGWGTGRIRSHYREAELSHLNMTRWFFQPSLGYGYDQAEAGFGFRFSRVSYDIRSSTLTQANNDEEWRTISAIGENPVLYLWEPGMTIRYGLEYIKLQLRTTWVVPFSSVDYPIARTNYSLGIHVMIDYPAIQRK